MTYKQARNILPQTVVMWDNNPDDKGVVTGVSSDGFFVVWENGAEEWIDFRGAQHVSIWHPSR